MNKKSKGKVLAIIGAVLLIALIAVVFLKFNVRNGLGENSSVFELTPDTNISNEELNKAAKLIENRTKQLGKKYKIATEDNKIKLWLGEGFLPEDADAAKYILDSITFKGNFNVNEGSEYSKFGKDGIQSVSVEKSTVSGLHDLFSDQFEQKSMYREFENYFDNMKDDADVYYLHIMLNDEASKDFQLCLDATDGKSGSESCIISYFDVEKGEHMSQGTQFGRVLTTKERSNSEFYIVNPYLDNSGLENLIKYMLESEDLPGKFSWALKDSVKYETGDQVTGKYQKEKIEGNAVELNFEMYYNTSRSSEDEDPAMQQAKILKDRLDILEGEYAIGYRGLGGRKVVARINPENIGNRLSLLLASRPDIAVSTAQKKLNDTVKSIEVAKNEQGQNCIAVEYKLDGTDRTLKDVTDDQTIYLIVNDVTVSSTQKPVISADTKEIKLYFSNLLCINKDTIADEDLKVAEYIVKCADNGQRQPTVSSLSAKYCDEEGNELEDDIAWGYESETDIDKKVISKINSEYSQATAKLSLTSPNMLNVKLDIPIDEKLPEEFTKTVQKIYRECGLGDGTYRTVMFSMKNETANSPIDRCRMGYNKMSISSDKPTMRGFCIVSGPTFDKYDKEIQNIIDTDPYFSSQQWDK